jgi:hypothetical protein
MNCPRMFSVQSGLSSERLEWSHDGDFALGTKLHIRSELVQTVTRTGPDSGEAYILLVCCGGCPMTTWPVYSLGINRAVAT